MGYELIREDFLSLLGCYTALFLLFIYIIKKELSFKTLACIAILFRLVLLFSTPEMSQDFYRFIWDGRMLMNGFNPYLYLPENYLDPNYILPNQAQELINGMGELNAHHYTNYPPINQLCFLIAALISNNSIVGSIITFKVILILADIGTLYFGKKLLARLNFNPNTIFLYILNPFIILELTGNLHFEGLMIFFLIWSLYLLHSEKWKSAAAVFALSIATKLLPLLFLPLFFKYFNLKRLIIFYALVGVSCIIMFAPFFSMEFINNYSQTIGLWFGQFEFNGGLYNIAKAIGYKITGYNTIKTIGKITPILVILFTLYLSFFRKNNSIQKLFIGMLFALSFYLFTSTTVHPWYLAMLLILSLFTTYRFPLVWTLMIILSYETYSNPEFKENLWLMFIQYAVVFGFLFWELYKKKKASLS